MNKYKLISLLLVATTLFTACGTQIKGFDKKIYTTGKVLSYQDRMINFTDWSSLAELYPDAVVEEITDEFLSSTDNQLLCAIDGDTLVMRHSVQGSPEELGLYRVSQKDFRALCTSSQFENLIPSGMEDRIDKSTIQLSAHGVANSRWLLVEVILGQSFVSPSFYYLYDLQTGSNQQIYAHSTDPDVGWKYGWTGSLPLIAGDQIYFDDIVSLDEKGYADISLFRYSIADGTLTKIAENARMPFLFEDKLCYMGRKAQPEENGYYGADLYYEDGSLFQAIDGFSGMIVNGSGNLTVYTEMISQTVYESLRGQNDSIPKTFELSEESDTLSAGYSLGFYQAEKGWQPVTVASGGVYVEWPHTDGRFLLFGSNGTVPKFYDIEKNCMVTLSGYSGSYFKGHFAGDSILFQMSEVNVSDKPVSVTPSRYLRISKSSLT